MRLNKHALAKKLGCSERALTDWQRAGLPVLEHGRRRGQPNTYDLGAVVRWLRATGRGQFHNIRAGCQPIDLAALERELKAEMQAPAPSAGVIVQTPASAAGVSGEILAGALALARVDWLEFLREEELEGVCVPSRVYLAENFIGFVSDRLQQLLGPAGAPIAASLEEIMRGLTSNPAGNVTLSSPEEEIENARALVPTIAQGWVSRG